MPTKPNRTKLTQLTVDKMKAGAERDTYWDTYLPGFGLRISPLGKKSWIVFYRVKGKPVFETLGSTLLIPKVDIARDLARASMLKAKQGRNPVDEKRAARQQEAQKGATTFKAVAERYFAERSVKQKASSAKEIRRLFDKDVLPHWGKRDIASIASADVRRLLDKIKDRGGTLIVANVVLRHLRTLFRWAVRAEHIEKDPTASIDRLVKEVERDRVLSDDEIIRFWSACETTGWPYGALFKLLLLTGQRRDEVGGMTRDELDLDKGLWVIPGERTKNGRLHEVHLSDLAVEIMRELPIINNSKFVFTTNGSALSGWSSAKTSLDKNMGCTDWRLHDLRRTAASGMARLNIPPHVVDKILNHSSGAIRGVAAVYNRYQYGDERKSALDAWSRYLETLVRPSGKGNVVRIRA